MSGTRGSAARIALGSDANRNRSPSCMKYNGFLPTRSRASTRRRRGVVPDGDREHAAHPRERVVAMLANTSAAITSVSRRGGERAPAANHLGAQLEVVVNLAVLRDRDTSAVDRDRLMAAADVDDAEARRRQRRGSVHRHSRCRRDRGAAASNHCPTRYARQRRPPAVTNPAIPHISGQHPLPRLEPVRQRNQAVASSSLNRRRERSAVTTNRGPAWITSYDTS